MAIVDMLMPQMGESITEGSVIKWLKKEGESVEKEEIILEISTDKVDSEIPSPYAGTVTNIIVAEGDTVPVGSVIAKIETSAAASIEAEQPKDEPVQQQDTAPLSVETTPASSGQSLYEMRMPQMGEGITEGSIIKWHKNVGDTVAKDEIILEISTDKVDTEIPSPQSGRLVELLADESETVAVGVVIARLEMAGVGVDVKSDSAPLTKDKGASLQPTPPAAVTASDSRAPVTDERRFYSPLVRRIARVEGISTAELATINGSGARGRVTKIDILHYIDTGRVNIAVEKTAIASQPAQVAQAKPQIASQPQSTVAATHSDDRVEVIPMDSMRKSIARHMVESIQTSAHVFMATESDMTNIVTYRTKNKDAFLQKTGAKLTYMPFITIAAAKALQDFPLVNSSVEGDNIIRKKHINIGIAVALENNGLIVPVIKDADGLNVVGMARSIKDIAGRARTKKLKPDEVKDGTFSITNMGIFGSLIGFPIISQPQVAILGLGAIQKRPVVIDDMIAVRSMIYLSLSFDHRIVDGALAGQFLERAAFYLTNFDLKNLY